MSRYSDKTEFHARMVVKEILMEVSEFGLRGDQHFCICFNINCMGVDIPKYVRDKQSLDPRLLIVIRRNEYDNLVVNDKGFAVDLGFDGVGERIFIPFSSMMSFIDPSENFHLSFEPRHQMQSIVYNQLPKFDNWISDNVILFPIRG